MATKDLPDGCCGHRKKGTEHDRPGPELIAQTEHALLNRQVMGAVAGAQEQAGDPSAQPIPLSEIARPSGRRLLGEHPISQRLIAAESPDSTFITIS